MSSAAALGDAEPAHSIPCTEGFCSARGARLFPGAVESCRRASAPERCPGLLWLCPGLLWLCPVIVLISYFWVTVRWCLWM